MKKIRYLLLFSLLFVAACQSAAVETETDAVAETADLPTAIPATEVVVEPTDVPEPTDEPVAEAQSGAVPTRIPESKYDDFELITLLPQDGIPAIDDPEFLTVEEADKIYAPDELVMGVNFNGDARAYSIPFLSGHEIVNDTVGDTKISVTW